MKTVREQIACVEREIAMRKRIYPRWVMEKKISAKDANYEIRCMECVKDSLLLMPKEVSLLKV